MTGHRLPIGSPPFRRAEFFRNTPVIHPLLAALTLIASLSTLPLLSAADSGIENEPNNPAREIENLGGHLFKNPRNGKIVEINLSGARNLTDEDLIHLSGYRFLTDLSLEGTAITGSGFTHFAKLRKLEWLNLWQTDIDDKALARLAGLKHLKHLKHLPIGSTRITDAGLEHLRGMPDLLYLGLRNTGVTDAGAAKLTALPSLQELNLRNTKVTDKCIESLLRIKTLQKVWLGETAVTATGLKRLRSVLPRCEIDLTGN